MLSLQKSLERLLDRSEAVLESGNPSPKRVPKRKCRFVSYAMAGLRDGVGKSTLAFNLGYKVSRDQRLLLLDACPQATLTEILRRKSTPEPKVTLRDLLLPQTFPTGEVSGWAAEISRLTGPFAGKVPVFFIPGGKELAKLQKMIDAYVNLCSELPRSYAERRAREMHFALGAAIREVNPLLHWTKRDPYPDEPEAEKIIFDSGPSCPELAFHVWRSVEALIIPLRIDGASLSAFKELLSLLANSKSRYRSRAEKWGVSSIPTIHAVVMTECGTSSKKYARNDATRSEIAEAMRVARRYPDLFSESNPADCFYLFDNFHSAVRTSNGSGIPIPKMERGERYVVRGQTQLVNASVERYTRQLRHLAGDL